jgi:hypothetical protein
MAVKKSSIEKDAKQKKSPAQSRNKPVLVEQNGDNTWSGQSSRPPTAIEHEIRRRAYELYEARGCLHGLDREDWIQAEAEVLSRYKESA